MNNRKFLILSRLASNPRGKVIGLVSFLLLFVLSLSLSAVANAQEPLEPPSTPDVENGSQLFADRCVNCHGIAGEGNGEMAGDLPLPPRDFTDEAYRRTAVPATMFQTITEGRLEAGMPPFGPTSSNPIPEADRWDLAATVFSLGLPTETINDGRIIYEENCLSCHGEEGMGDGPEASNQESQPTDLTDLRYWSSRSNEMVFSALQDEEVQAHSYTHVLLVIPTLTPRLPWNRSRWRLSAGL
jgi:mono/diheme cytochrome c family protein